MFFNYNNQILNLILKKKKRLLKNTLHGYTNMILYK